VTATATATNFHDVPGREPASISVICKEAIWTRMMMGDGRTHVWVVAVANRWRARSYELAELPCRFVESARSGA